MKVVANMDFEINTYIPGIRIKTSPTNFYPIEQVQMMKFSGENRQLFGPILDGHAEWGLIRPHSLFGRGEARPPLHCASLRYGYMIRIIRGERT